MLNGINVKTIGVALVLVGLGACGNLKPNTAMDDSSDGVGAIKLKLTLSGGNIVNDVDYSLTNGGNDVQSGSISTQHSESISFQLGNVPGGPGYTVTLTAKTTKGGTCTGTAGPFFVAAHATTTVSVPMACYTAPSDAGNVLVNGSTYNCASWVSLATVDPTHQNTNGNEANVGFDITLIASAAGFDPNALTYTWTSSNNIGTFGANNAMGANDTTTFTCTAPGTTMITLTVADGPVPDGGMCDAMLSTVTTIVECDGPAAQPCNMQTFAGGDAPETHTVEMGATSGTFTFSYDTFQIEDQIIVSYEGNTLFDTGCVGASGTQTLSYSGASTQLTVKVNPDCANPGGTGTAWNYTVNCPQ